MKKAYTVAELLVVISLITIFSGIGLYFSYKVKQVNRLERAKIFLASKIHLARSYALSPRKVNGATPFGFGIYISHFPTDHFYLFADLDNDHEYSTSSDVIIKKFFLEKLTEISSACFLEEEAEEEACKEVCEKLHLFFAFPDAKVYFNGAESVASVKITLKEKSSGKEGEVYVNQLGQISF